jgi:hypothetical protein
MLGQFRNPLARLVQGAVSKILEWLVSRIKVLSGQPMTGF